MTFTPGSRCVGFFDRSGMPTNKTYLNWNNSNVVAPYTTAEYNAVLGGFIIAGQPGGSVGGGLAWQDLQPNAGSPAGTGALASANGGTSAIDFAFAQADAYNSTNPTYPITGSPDGRWTLKMRIFCGEKAPSWAQALSTGPVKWKSGSTATPPNTTYTVGMWWTTAYLNAWSNFIQTLAAYVPNYTVSSSTSSFGLPVGANTHALAGHPLLGEVTNSLGMTLYAEPMLKDDFNTASPGTANPWFYPSTGLAALGYNYGAVGTAGTDLDNFSQSITLANSAFTPTPTSTSANPYLKLTSGGKVVESAQAITFMNDIIALTWPQGVLENNSLDASSSNYTPSSPPTQSSYHDREPGYTSIYTTMIQKSKGASGTASAQWGLTPPTFPIPTSIQTSSFNNMTGLTDFQNTLSYGIWIGAKMLELPTDAGAYFNLTPTQLGSYVQALINNDPGGTTGGSTFFDQSGTTIGTTSPYTVTATGVDGAAGRLVVAVGDFRLTSDTFTAPTSDSITGAVTLGDDYATSLAGHHHSMYAYPTTGVTADTDTMTVSVHTNAPTHAALAIASYFGFPNFIGKSPLDASTSGGALPVYAGALIGNLLTAFVTTSDATPAQTTLSGTSAATNGWTCRVPATGTNCETEIWDKIAVGSDVMPTWNTATGTRISVQIAEFGVTSNTAPTVAPTMGTATIVGYSGTFNWSLIPTLDDGGCSITGQTVSVYYASSGTIFASQNVSASTTSANFALAGNSTGYYATVYGTNCVSTSPVSSNSNTITTPGGTTLGQFPPALGDNGVPSIGEIFP
jgi:hypothetical protein